MILSASVPMLGQLNQFNPVDFDALVPLARGIADALVRFDHLYARAAKRAGMQIDVARAIVRHHKAEAFLVVEELDLAFDHGAGRRAVAVKTAAAAKAPAAATST